MSRADLAASQSSKVYWVLLGDSIRKEQVKKNPREA